MNDCRIIEQDPMLEVFLRLCVEQQIPITLQMAGFLISGILIDEREFLKAVFPSLKTEHAGLLSTKGRTTQARYIHLKNTRFFNAAGDGIPTESGVVWRGRLSEVAGFFLGSLTADLRCRVSEMAFDIGG